MKRTHMKDRLFVISQYVLPHHLISRRPAAWPNAACPG